MWFSNYDDKMYLDYPDKKSCHNYGIQKPSNAK